MKQTQLQAVVRRALETRSAEEIAAKAKPKPCSATTIRNAAAGKVIGPKLARRIAMSCGATNAEIKAVVEESLSR